MAALPTTSFAAETRAVQTETAPPSGLAALGVDGSVLLVQTVNFFLLLLILSWLLYRPLLRLLSDRQKTIAEGLAAAEAQKRAAPAAEIERAEILAQTRQEAAGLITQVREELKAERAVTRAALAKERERLVTAMERRLAAEQAKLEASLHAKLTSLIIKAVERISQVNPLPPADLAAQIAKTVKDLE